MSWYVSSTLQKLGEFNSIFMKSYMHYRLFSLFFGLFLLLRTATSAHAYHLLPAPQDPYLQLNSQLQSYVFPGTRLTNAVFKTTQYSDLKRDYEYQGTVEAIEPFYNLLPDWDPVFNPIKNLQNRYARSLHRRSLIPEQYKTGANQSALNFSGMTFVKELTPVGTSETVSGSALAWHNNMLGPRSLSHL